MFQENKKWAAATGNSDHPAKENPYKNQYSISDLRAQERFSSINGRVLRWINIQRQFYTPLKSVVVNLKEDGVRAKDVHRSIGYLSAKGYIGISKNKQAIKITAQGIRLLAGTIEDSRVAI